MLVFGHTQRTLSPRIESNGYARVMSFTWQNIWKYLQSPDPLESDAADYDPAKHPILAPRVADTNSTPAATSVTSALATTDSSDATEAAPPRSGRAARDIQSAWARATWFAALQNETRHHGGHKSAHSRSWSTGSSTTPGPLASPNPHIRSAPGTPVNLSDPRQLFPDMPVHVRRPPGGTQLPGQAGQLNRSLDQAALEAYLSDCRTPTGSLAWDGSRTPVITPSSSPVRATTHHLLRRIGFTGEGGDEEGQLWEGGASASEEQLHPSARHFTIVDPLIMLLAQPADDGPHPGVTGLSHEWYIPPCLPLWRVTHAAATTSIAEIDSDDEGGGGASTPPPTDIDGTVIRAKRRGSTDGPITAPVDLPSARACVTAAGGVGNLPDGRVVSSDRSVVLPINRRRCGILLSMLRILHRIIKRRPSRATTAVRNLVYTDARYALVDWQARRQERLRMAAKYANGEYFCVVYRCGAVWRVCCRMPSAAGSRL